SNRLIKLCSGLSFSPLFIGEGSSTTAPRQSVPREHCFQSPLHRGRVFNSHDHAGHSPAPRLLSVPSSSGKGLQRCDAQHTLTTSATFQSPLHRGRVFNRRRFSRARTECVLSVPSSSGKGLQLGRNAFEKGVQEAFQSPLHRGRVFNGRSLGTFLNAWETFSPLFIGEGSSTTHGSRRPRCGSAFSPLFIGEGSSTPTLPVFALPLSLLSVPSSSGKGLQRRRRARCCCR